MTTATRFTVGSGLSVYLVLIAMLSLTFTLAGMSVADEQTDGFMPLFNGKDLSGWKLRGGESLAGKSAAPKNRISVQEGELRIDGQVKGNMVIDTEREFAGDVLIRFEYLPAAGCNNDLYFRGLKFDLKQGNVKNIQEGQWNQFEIVVQGKQVEFKNNGQVQRTEQAKSDSSPLGLRAEFGSMAVRKMGFQ